MRVSGVVQKGNTLKFVLEDTNVSFANALRRAMISEVPVLAIENVSFFENSSSLYDEIIAHRLGLIPIRTDKSFELQSECTCKGRGCSKCQVEFTLVKKGPCTVYSGDLKCSDTKTSVSDAEIPITKLSESQKIKLEAIAVMNTGKEHAKWQPGIISYKYYPDIKLNGAGKEVINICPRHVFALEKGKIAVKEPENCSLCMACVDETKGKVEVHGIENKFIFFVESNGFLKPQEIVLEAAKILEKKAKEFGKEVK